MPKVALLLLVLAALSGIAGAEAPPAGIDAAGGATPVPAGSIYFGHDSAAIDHAAIALLSRRLTPLHDDPSLDVLLRGYADDLSSPAYELAVGQKRLDAVRAALVAAGIPASRIRRQFDADGLTEAQYCTDEECREKLWRIDIFLKR